jgi:glutaredoxin 3
MENQPRVRVFSTPSCPYCFTLKEFLKDHGINFEDIDLSQDQISLDEVMEKTGQMGVPVVSIGEEFITGFDKEKIVKLLNIKE